MTLDFVFPERVWAARPQGNFVAVITIHQSCYEAMNTARSRDLMVYPESRLQSGLSDFLSAIRKSQRVDSVGKVTVCDRKGYDVNGAGSKKTGVQLERD